MRLEIKKEEGNRWKTGYSASSIEVESKEKGVTKMRVMHLTEDHPEEFKLKLCCAGLDFPALWVYKRTTHEAEQQMIKMWGNRNVMYLEAPDDVVELYQSFEANELYIGSPAIEECFIRSENFPKININKGGQ